MKVKWGVIGAGGIARRRSIPEVVKFSEKSQITALMDVSKELIEETGKQFGIDQCYTSVEEIFKQDIDAVYIASPVFEHEKQVAAALKAGKHVLCEKPMALTPVSYTHLDVYKRQRYTLSSREGHSRTGELSLKW